MKKIIIAIFVVLLFSITGYFFGPSIVNLFSKSPNEQTKTHQIKKGEILVTILATGSVQPANRLEIKPPVAGRVDKVLVVEGQKVVKGQILAWMSSSERAALIDSARAQGPAEVKKWEEMYKSTPIVAPISGMIILKNVEAGQSFTINDAVLVMSNRLTVKAQVDETDLAQIKVKQKCQVRLDSYPEQVIDSSVDRIAYEAKTVSNVTTYTVEILPEQTPVYMRSGMTANVTFFVETKKDVLVIPTEFIKYENGKPIATIGIEKGKTKNTEIRLGATDGKNTEIISGLSVDDQVILTINSSKDRSINPFSPMGRSNKSGSGKR